MNWVSRSVIIALAASMVIFTLGLPLVLSQNLDLNNQTASVVGQTVTFTISIINAPTALSAYGFAVGFDSTILQFNEANTTGTLADNTLFAVNTSGAGNIPIAGITITGEGMDPGDFSFNPILAGTSGTLVRLIFTVLRVEATTLTITTPVDDLAQEGWNLGDGQLLVASGLTFVTLTPCRLFDTRLTTAGILTPGTIRIFAVEGTSGSPGNLSAQGGALGGCNVPDPLNGGIAAVVVNLAATQAAGPGNIGIAPHNPAGGPPDPNVSFINFGQLSSPGPASLANMVVIPVCTAGCAQGEDIDIQARNNNVHLVGDVVGYFGTPTAAALGATALETSPLECISSFSQQIVADNTDFSFLSPACAPTETLMASFYEFLDATGAALVNTTDVEMNWPVPDPEGSNAMLCQGSNQSGMPVVVGCGANCCRTRDNQ